MDSTPAMSIAQGQGVNAVGHVETRGVDYIPAEERNSSPRELFAVFFGANMCFGIIVLGWLPIVFGLGWWAAFWAITVGTVLGTLFFGPMGLIGPRTGTNAAVSSGAFFGVVGRIVGSLDVLFIAIGFYALAVWTGGEAVVAGANRLFGLPEGKWELGIAYGIIGLITVILALVGHATLVLTQKIIAPVIAAVLAVGVLVELPHFNASYAGGHYILGSFWPTWVLSMTTAAALALSYGPFANDYARYLPVKRARAGAFVASIGLGLGCWFALIFAAYFATLFSSRTTDFVLGMVAISPAWYAVPLVLVGVVGGFGQGSLALYGTGLDTSSLVPRLKRTQATLVISVLGVGLVYLGSLVWNAINLVNSFVTILTITTAPWLVITIMGHFAVRGRYATADMQVFNARLSGGIYWFTRGWNVYAIAAWGCSLVLGLLFTNSPPVLEGPWRNAAGGVDLSFLSAAAAAFLLYGTFLLVIPDRAVRRSWQHALEFSDVETPYAQAVPMIAPLGEAELGEAELS